ncbi:MAG: galactose mutarotase [Verrucomicrobia bacterium]|nr:galactose mutarotase [Verrucomicrobiota bacterium]
MQTIKSWFVVTGAGLGAAFLLGCAGMSGTSASITKSPFGKTPDGTPVDLYTLRNANGVEARICTYGGIVVSLKTPDRNGKSGDIVLGYDELDSYVRNNPFFGCFVGRYGNRIAGGQFTLDGRTYTLAKNNGPNHLHGGLKGFDKAVWSARTISTPQGPALEMRYLSKDGEEGYPGNLNVVAVYRLTEDNGLRLDYAATTDKPTVVNLTQHSYYNLAGKGDVLDHEVMIAADRFTAVDATLIPTGELRPVKGTPLDFTTPTRIGLRINADDEQIRLGNGYDHNFVLNKPAGQLGLAARVYEPTTGRVMEVLTTAPGMQLYTGNFLDGTITGKGGWVYQQRHGFCMEAQHFPDSPNQPAFPSTVLRPGQTYQNTIIYRFSAR